MIVLVLLALSALLPLAWLQYHWIDQLSEAEWQRMHAHVTAALDGFRDDFERQFSRLPGVLFTAPPQTPDENVADVVREMHLRLEATSTLPLIQDIYLLRLDAKGKPEWFEAKTGATRLDSTRVPKELQEIGTKLAADRSLAGMLQAGSRDVLVAPRQKVKRGPAPPFLLPPEAMRMRNSIMSRSPGAVPMLWANREFRMRREREREQNSRKLDRDGAPGAQLREKEDARSASPEAHGTSEAEPNKVASNRPDRPGLGGGMGHPGGMGPGFEPGGQPPLPHFNRERGPASADVPPQRSFARALRLTPWDRAEISNDPPSAWWLVPVEMPVLRQKLLPELVNRWFHRDEELDFVVRVETTDAVPRLIYTSDASVPAQAFQSADANGVMYLSWPRPRQRSTSNLSTASGNATEPRPASTEEAARAAQMRRNQQRMERAMLKPWMVSVRNRSASLKDMAEITRRKNLLVSSGILIVLAMSFGIIVVAMRRSQQLVQLQMEFVAGVSHELRTPLSVICAAGDNLAEGHVAGEPQVRRYGSVIRAEGRRLGRMVEQILGFASLESGRSKLELTPVTVEEVVKAGIEASADQIRKSGTEVEVKLDGDLPAICGDVAALAQCVRNLIDNAITHGGGSWVGIRGEFTDAARKEVRIAVDDRGSGIRKQERKRIFDPFYRGRRALDDQVPGSGVGLALVRRIIEAHGGSVSVTDSESGGARFLMRFPALATSKVETDAIAEDPVGGRRSRSGDDAV